MNTVWNDKELEIIDDLFGNYSVIDSPISRSIGGDSKKKIVANWFTSLPDVSYSEDIMIAEDNVVITNWTCIGKHKGVLLGAEPTGKKIKYSGTSTFKFSQDQKISSYHAITNTFDVMKSNGISVKPSIMSNYEDPEKLIQCLIYSYDIKFTQTEIKVLAFWLHSFSAKSMSYFLEIKPSTADKHLSNIRSRFINSSKQEVMDYLRSHQVFQMFDSIFYDIYIKKSNPLK
jgi:predicted ester cyclase/DNA-binding CsgD family transcriptional regulator